MQPIHSLQKVVWRLQLLAAVGGSSLLGALLASIKLQNPKIYGGSRLLLFTPTPLTVSLFFFGCILLLIYFWQHKNLKCPNCRTRLERNSKQENHGQEDSTYLYLCNHCGVWWNSGISTGGW